MEKIKYELTQEQVNMLYDMADLCLKTGGLKNLPAINEVMEFLKNPISCNPQN